VANKEKKRGKRGKKRGKKEGKKTLILYVGG
jgi:hypothetical protein